MPVAVVTIQRRQPPPDFIQPAPQIGITFGDMLTPRAREWMPRVRHVLQHTDRRVLIVGCTLTKNFPADFVRAYGKHKRLIWWETQHAGRHANSHMPVDVGLVIQLKWKSHAMTSRALHDADKLGILVTPNLSPNEVLLLIDNGMTTDAERAAYLDEAAAKMRADGRPAEAIAMAHVVAESLVYETQPVPDPINMAKSALRPGQLTAWMSQHANLDAESPYQEIARLAALAERPGPAALATTPTSIGHAFYALKRKRAAAPPPPAPLPAPVVETVPTPEPARLPALEAPPEPVVPPVDTIDQRLGLPPLPSPEAVDAVTDPLAYALVALDVAANTIAQARLAVLAAQGSHDRKVKEEVKRVVEARVMKAMEAAMTASEGDETHG